MRFRVLIGFFLVALVVITGCQGPPPTVIYIVISPTPDVTEVAATQAPLLPATALAGTSEAVAVAPTVPFPTVTPVLPSPTSLPQASATPIIAPTLTTAATTAPAAAVATALPPNFPTPVVAQIQVAEELFEHGRMFWIGPIKQIWVLMITSEGHGTWSIYQDTYVDTEPENDPSLVPPAGRYQPQRGFGKLWRESPGLRDKLGWGVTPEFGYASHYEYHSGGTIDASGNYVRGPGYHILFSLAGEMFRFNEADGTWQLGNG